MSASPTLVRVVQSTLAMLVVLGVLAPAAVAGTPLNGGPAPLTGSTFQGADGNQKTPLPGDPDHVGMPARTDWQTYASSPRLSTLPDGSGLQDRWFFQGKEEEPDKWTFQQDTVSPGKADVLGAWSATEPVSADVFLYLSFFRAAAGGTTFYNFELNQLTSTWTNSQGTVIPCRKDGDIIVTFELQGGAGDVGVRVWRWESTEPGPAACPEGKVGTWTASGQLGTDAMGNTIAQGAMNAGPIANYLDFNLDGDNDRSTNPSPSSFDTADTFGEAALNLTKVLSGLNSGDSCFNFGQLQLHTRSASPFTADLKDFIAPQPIIARSCAIEGTKYHDLDADGTQDSGEPGLSGFRIYADKDNSGNFEAGEPNTFTADGTQPGKPLGSWVLDNLPAGNYKIREDLTNTSGNPRATEGWNCSDPSPCNFDVPLANGGVVGGLEFGNYKKALVRVEKQTVPDGAAGSFGFTSSLPGKSTFDLTDGGVEEALVKPGVYTASETLHPDFNLTNVACTAGGQVTSPTAVQFNATSGQTITCTYTNSRKTGELTVRKVLDPTTDPGKFDLKIGSDVVVDDGGHLSQGTRTLATGTDYTVSEIGGTGTSLSKYDSSVVCKDGDVTVASGSGTSLADVPVAEGRNVICTFTNTRRNGKLTVVKDLKPADDPRRFDLKIGDEVVKAQAGDGDSGSKSVPPGSYTVSEAGGSLAKYDSSVSCDNGQSGDGSSLAGVTVDSNDDVTCTITNTRRNGKLTVVKDLKPADDPGRFDLKIGDEVVKAAAGDGDAGSKSVAPGSYTVSEAGETLAKYDSSVSCDNGQSGDGSSLAGVTVDSNDDVTCTITNTRRNGKLTVVKDLKPADDPGRFDLKIGDEVVKAAAGDGDAGSKSVAPGSYTVSETGGSLAKYDSSIACDNGQSDQGSSLAGVTVDSNDVVVCTITNTRKKGSLTVVKDLVPAADAGRFDLRIGDEVVKAAAADGGSGTRQLAPGSYAVSELGAGGAALADYASSIACDNGKSGQGTLLSGIQIDSGDDVTCTITNTRLGKVEIEKQTLPGGDSKSFGFTATGLSPATFQLADAGVRTFDRVAPNAGGAAYEVTEDAAPGYRLSAIDCGQDGDSSGSTVSRKASIHVSPGETVRCKFVNTKLDAAIAVVKTGTERAHHGDALSYTFDVSNEGNTPLHDVAVSDDRCAPVTRVSGDAVLDPGEHWTYECSYAAPAHQAGEEDPIVNTVTASAKDEQDTPVSATDKHETDLIHPDIEVVKEVDKAKAHVGDTLNYKFEVSNAGDTPVAVEFSDPRCDAGTLTGPTGDADSDQRLDVTETWVYRCSHVATAQSGDPVVNTVKVTGTDDLGGKDSDEDSTETDVVRPDIEVVKTVDKDKAHVGDKLTYTFNVTNEGDTPLAVEFSDPRCDAGTLVAPDDDVLGVDETWTYTCTHVVTGQSGDPVVNTVKVTGTDDLGGKDSDEDSTQTDVLHPDIEIDKRVDRQSAHVGDKLTYTFEVTNAGDTPLTVEFSDPRCDAGTLVAPDDDVLGVDETWTYTCTHVVTNTDPNPLPNTAKVTGTDELGGKDSDEDSASVAIIKPGALVVKSATEFAYPGDTVTFTFKVTNNGNAPLTNVVVKDDRCAPVTRVSGDAALDPGETWSYTCSKQIPPGHKIGDENPIRNVATVTGKDPLGKTVTDEDDHKVRVLHPAVAIEKTGPATALAGSALAYALTVTNPGDVAFASQQVIVTDPRCEAPPAGPNTSGDPTPGWLDPGDKWTYTCTAQTTGQPAGTFVNTAKVTAKDPNDRTVTDTDDFPTVLEAQQVLPNPEIISGRARLRGPSGCVRGPFTATVRGRRIARVTFYRDGKRIKTISAKRGQRKFTVRVKPGNRTGVHRVTARIRFRANSGTRARTLRLSYQRCRRQVVQPRFTG